MTLPRLLQEQAVLHGAKTLWKNSERSVTYAEADLLTNRLANWFLAQGIKPGDRIAIQIPNSPEFLIAYFAAGKAGAIAMPVSPLLHPEEVAYVLSDAEAVALVSYSPLLDKVREANCLPDCVKLLVSEAPREGAALLSEILRQTGFSALPVTASQVKPDDTAAFMYTSGTTGRPKAAMLSHDNLLFDAKSAVDFIQMREEDVFLCVLPLFHSFAVTVCSICSLVTGATVYIMPSFVPHEVLEVLATEHVSVFPAVPAMLGALLQREVEPAIFQSVRLIVSGGAPLPVAIFEAYKQRFGVEIIEGDGPTECSPITSVNPTHGVKKPGSIGLALPGTQMQIRDEAGLEVPSGQVGEIVVQGRHVMQGYWNQPEATTETIRDGWLYTGDLGYEDEEGYFFIVDRKKDMLITAGMNVYPREIEEVLYRHPAVKECAVIGRYDEQRGEVPVAVVALKEGSTATDRELINHCRGSLARYKIPKAVIFMDALPRTTSGKIQKRLLTKELDLSKGD